MPMTDFLGPFHAMPIPQLASSAPNFDLGTLTGNTSKRAIIFRWPATGTVTKIGFQGSTISVPGNVDARVESVDLATGLPSGSLIAAGANKVAAGYPTIGFGHLIKPGERIEEPLLGEAAEKLLARDVAPKVAAVNARVSVPLFQGQFDAVLSWTYNLGEGALKSSTMLKKINAGRHEEVPVQIKRWNRAGGKVLKGLERRREAEAALYRMRWY